MSSALKDAINAPSRAKIKALSYDDKKKFFRRQWKEVPYATHDNLDSTARMQFGIQFSSNASLDEKKKIMGNYEAFLWQFRCSSDRLKFVKSLSPAERKFIAHYGRIAAKKEGESEEEFATRIYRKLRMRRLIGLGILMTVVGGYVGIAAYMMTRKSYNHRMAERILARHRAGK